MNINRIYFLSIIFLIIGFAMPLNAQTEISGKLTDATDGRPVDGAIVSLHNADAPQKRLTFAVTKQDGSYVLKCAAREGKGLLFVRSLGYKEHKQEISLGRVQTINISLASSSIQLREVTVRSVPIRKAGDTITYKAHPFIRPGDHSLEDILKRMPGIEIEDNGQIKYNGKGISKFYIEDINLLDGRYAIASRNLKPEDIGSVQVYENHQPIRMLRDLSTPSEAALNIRLKKKSLGRPIGKIELGGGYKYRYLGNLVLMGFMQNFQYITTLKGNNTGEDIASEHNDFLNQSGIRTSRTEHLGSNNPYSSAPVADHRKYDNQSVGITFNMVKRFSSTQDLRIQTSYLKDQKKYNAERTVRYALPDGSSVSISELMAPRLKNRKFSMGATYERNEDENYLKNRFQIEGTLIDNHFHITQDHQPINHLYSGNHFALVNNSDFMFKMGSNVHYINATVGAFRSPTATISISNPQSQLKQTLFSDGIHAKLSSSDMYNLGNHWMLNLSYRLLGVWETYHTRRDNKQQKLNGYDLSAHITPSLNWKANSSSFFVNLPFQWSVMRYRDIYSDKINRISKPLWNIGTGFTQSFEPYWTLSVSGNFSQALGDMTGYMTMDYPRDYRYMSANGSGVLSLNKNIRGAFRIHYRNPITTLFSSLSASASHFIHNQLINSEVQSNGQIISSYFGGNISGNQYRMDWNIGQYLVEQHLTAKLNVSNFYTTTSMMRNGQMLPIRYNRLLLSPALYYSPISQLSASLSLRYRLNSNWIKQPQGNDYTTNRMGLENLFKISWLVNKRMELYALWQTDYNEYRSGQFKTMHFLDAGMRFQGKNWELDLSSKNLTNQTYYGLSTNDMSDVITESYTLQPLTFMVSYIRSF